MTIEKTTVGGKSAVDITIEASTGTDGMAEDGDTYDEDTGDFLGNLDLGIVENTLPAQIGIFHNGYWYIFKPQERYKAAIDKAPVETTHEAKPAVTREMIDLAAELDRGGKDLTSP